MGGTRGCSHVHPIALPTLVLMGVSLSHASGGLSVGVPQGCWEFLPECLQLAEGSVEVTLLGTGGPDLAISYVLPGSCCGVKAVSSQPTALFWYLDTAGDWAGAGAGGWCPAELWPVLLVVAVGSRVSAPARYQIWLWSKLRLAHLTSCLSFFSQQQGQCGCDVAWVLPVQFSS